MTTQLATLERALERLAQEFAARLISEVVSARIADLGAALHGGAIEVVVPQAPTAPARRVRRVPPPAAVRRRPMPSPRRVDDSELPEDGLDVITDPGLLLEVIGSSPKEAAPRVARSDVSELLADGEPKTPTDATPAPVLRPGERAQRSAGGTLVLRRRGR